ncbi:hypothetical protein EV424DRAFT_1418096 [Suillus variegatus]|nr:hypothetical protein EV424DRAFT_1442491 [Suillus variegatus]KAG1797273.1 hypothetical protein EV424DRAFT_1442266 [Suillus variegatus]KAG1812719.1 hypothetical protein EV424DRAFT_1418096 [Suillus variegatus]
MHSCLGSTMHVTCVLCTIMFTTNQCQLLHLPMPRQASFMPCQISNLRSQHSNCHTYALSVSCHSYHMPHQTLPYASVLQLSVTAQPQNHCSREILSALFNKRVI